MILFSRVLCVLVAIGVSLPAQAAAPPSFSEALHLLEETSLGKKLILQSTLLWKTSRQNLQEVAFRWGTASKTDTTLTRHFDPHSGREIRERSLTIFLKQDQSLLELALDMAHELVHATSKPSYDPYDPSLSVGKYIRSAIDGMGGEVDAVLQECQMGQEIAQHHAWSLKRCQRYSLGGMGDRVTGRTLIQKEFYRVGKWKPYLHRILGSESQLFVELSSASPVLFSSTGQAPYPVALLREYEEMTRAACKNSFKRQETIERSGEDSTRFSSVVSSAAASVPAFAAFLGPSIQPHGQEQGPEGSQASGKDAGLKRELDHFIRQRCKN